MLSHYYSNLTIILDIHVVHVVHDVHVVSTVLATIIDTPKKSIFLHDDVIFSVKFLSCRKTKSISIDWKRI